MKYSEIAEGLFIERPNRFIAKVRLGDDVETVHVKNTGRCKELLIPGKSIVRLDAPGNPSRKTKYDLVSVYKDNFGWINIDRLQTRWFMSGFAGRIMIMLSRSIHLEIPELISIWKSRERNISWRLRGVPLR